MSFQASISNLYLSQLSRLSIGIDQISNQTRKTLEIAVNSVALNIFTYFLICCLPFLYRNKSLFIISLPVGMIFSNLVEDIDARMKRIWECNKLLLGLLFLPWGVKGLAGLEIVGTIYSAARLTMLINVNSREKENQPTRPIIKESTQGDQTSIFTFYSQYSQFSQHFQTLPKIRTVMAKASDYMHKAIETVVNKVALDVFAYFLVCCLPFFYIKNNLFMVSLALGIVFPKVIEDVDARMKRIWEHNKFLLGLLFVPWGIKGMPGLLIIGTIYSAARLAMLINVNSRNKEREKIKQIILETIHENSKLASNYKNNLSKENSLNSLSEKALLIYEARTKFHFYPDNNLGKIMREGIKKQLEPSRLSISS